jgi:hypothetical protein
VTALNYEPSVRIPGMIRLNGSVSISKDLPDNWNIEIKLKVDLPYIGFINVPIQNGYAGVF